MLLALMLLFCTKSAAKVVQNCVQMFSCFPVHECVAKRGHKFLVNYVTSDNSLSFMCKNSAARELNMLHQPRLFILIQLSTIVKHFYLLVL